MKVLSNRKAMFCMWLLFLLTFLAIVGYKYKMKETAINEQNIVLVKLIETTCSGIGDNRSSSSFVHNGAIHLINLKGEDCNNYIPGSVVQVLYNAEDNIYFPININTKDEKMGIAILLFVVLISTLNFFFPKLFAFFKSVFSK